MNQAIDYLTARSEQEWLIGYASRAFADRAWHRYQALSQSAKPPIVLLTERCPIEFLASFMAACAANCPVFLGNPDWVESDWQQVLGLVTPDVIWGECPLIDPAQWCRRPDGVPQRFAPASGSFDRPQVSPSKAMIMISTGGSSGHIRFAMHDWETLMASVQGFRAYFGVDRVNSCCVLPLHHVSGLMQFLRSFTSGGQLVIQPFKQLESGKLPAIQPSEFFLSLVPTQLQRLISPRASALPLADFKAIFLGGAPAWESLLAQARSHQLPIAPTYGMTETASQIATLKPVDFLSGQTGCGQVLPHARVQILSPTGENLPVGQIGSIAIQATSLMLGHYPDISPPTSSAIVSPKYHTDDLGYLDAKGYLHIVGRSSQKIITGGENVFPAEVEAAIRATDLVQDVCVLGLPDQQWGQIVTAVYVPSTPAVEGQDLQRALAAKLSKFKCPKRWIALETMPHNAQGKLNFAQIEQIIRRN